MSEEVNAPAGQTDDASGKSEKTSESVAYDTYRKSVNAEKNAKARAAELESELLKIRQEKDLAEGNKDKVIDDLRKRYESLEGEFKKTKTTYAWSTLTGEIKREAIRNGCKDPDKFIRLMDDEDLRAIEVGEDFSISKDSLEKVITKGKKDNFFLFEGGNKIAANGTPSTRAPVEEKNLKDLSLDELKAKYKNITKR